MALISETIHVHVHIHDSRSIESKLDKVLKNQKIMAKKTDEIKALLAEQAATITNLASDLDRIAERIENSPSESDLEEIAADLRGKNDQLKALADRNIVEETPGEPQPEPES